MSLHVHRSPRVEELVASLHDVLEQSWPRDPFAPVPVVVGSRGIGRWLRHELATRARSAALIDFIFPRNAFEAAAAWLLSDPESKTDSETVFWSAQGETEDAWTGPRLIARVLLAIRARLDRPELAAVRRYLRARDAETLVREEGAPVGGREVSFASQVAAVVERMHYDRPTDALAWSRDPSAAPEDARWIASILAALEAETSAETEDDGPAPSALGPSPASRLASLESLAATHRHRIVHVFGLSTLRPGDKLRLRALARHLDLHLYLLVPSTAWWGDLKTKREQVKVLRDKLDQGGVTALDREELDELFGANELLAANGGPSRDLQLWLEESDYVDVDVEREAPLDTQEGAPPTLLRAVQRWIDRAAPTPRGAEAPWKALAGCDSIELHACHGPLRQCEALRDELMRRFAADPTLEPRHVLVTTPDIATYAPLVAAVFSRRSGAASAAAPSLDAPGAPSALRVPEVPAIPVHIADLGISSTNPIADALLRTLAFTEERVTASALVELLALWPVRARFELEESDLADVRELVAGSQLRWAWDEHDRGSHSQPALDQNTVRFGLERLALGVLMPDDDELGYIDGRDGFGPTAPFDVASRDRVARFGKLAAFCAAVDEQRRKLQKPATPGEWLTRFREAMDALTLVEDEAAWLRGQVDDALADRLPAAMGGGFTLDRAGVTGLVADAFELPTKGDRPVTGAVTVCAMEPMRSVPFRIIAMLGLDDGAFPRAGKAPAWDPFAKPRSGEHDRRVLDRHLFLESLLCARDALLLFGSGFERKRGQEKPLSVVAIELEELMARATGTDVDAASDAGQKRRHPLQPWSEEAFASARAKASGPPSARTASGAATPTHDRLPFDPIWFESRRAIAERDPVAARAFGLGATGRSALWPIETNPPTTLSAAQMAAAFENASKELLKQRLGVEVERWEDELSDREPLELESLDGWSVRDRVLAVMQREATAGAATEGADGASSELDSTLERLTTRLRAEGMLPLDAGGQAVLDGCVRAARTAHARSGEIGVARRPPLAASVVIGDLTLTAVAPDVRAMSPGSNGAVTPLELVWTTASKKPNEKSRLTAWISLLVARAAGHPVRGAHVVGVDDTESVECGDDAARAEERLTDLVALWRDCRQRAVPLFPQLSRALVEAALKDPALPLEDLLMERSEDWDGNFMFAGARENAWVAALYPDTEVEDLADGNEDILDVARRVWEPLFAKPTPPPKSKPTSTSTSTTKPKGKAARKPRAAPQTPRAATEEES